MKQAILILSHKVEHLENLIKVFDNNFEIYIHVDKKTRISPVIKKQILAYPQVKLLIQEYKIYWGDVNLVKATLFLCKKVLLSKEIEYIHLISGMDFPVRNIEFFQYFFEQNRNKQYLENFRLPSSKWKDGGINRLEYFYPTRFIDLHTEMGKKIFYGLLRWQKRFKIKRNISYENPIYGGSTWWSLSRKCVEYVVDYSSNFPYLLRRLRFSLSSDEIYFQTIIMNSIYAQDVINDNLRYIVWDYKNGNYPANLDSEDLVPIFLSNSFFARKIQFPYAFELFEQLVKFHINFLNRNLLNTIKDKKSLLKCIADYLYEHAADCKHKGLYYGTTGMVIFLYHYAQFISDPRYSNKAYELLNIIIEGIDNIEYHDYAEGILGIATSIEYLHLQDFIHEDTNEILEDIDNQIVNLFNNKEFEYLKQLNDTFRFDKYIELRVQNVSTRNLLNDDWIKKHNIPKSQSVCLFTTGDDLGMNNYYGQILGSNCMGIFNGYTGIGFQLLSTFSNNNRWRCLF